MATKSKPASKETVLKALNSMGYYEQVSKTDPYIETSPKYFTIFIQKQSGDSPRRNFLQELSDNLNKKPHNLFASYNSKRSTTPKSSVGKIEFIGSDIVIICKYYPSFGLKPSNISPSIVNKFMKPEEMVKNVITYLNKNKITGPLKKQIVSFLEESLNPNTYEFQLPGQIDEVLVPAEFMEVCSAIKMAALLRVNDAKIRKVLRVPPRLKFSSASPIKIYIPLESNFPLTDYEIAFLADDTDTTFKVSVKSKVKSDKTNTVKFSQIFENTNAVGFWFRHLNSQIKAQNYGPAQVAFSALRYYGQSAAGKKGKAATKKSAAIPPRPAEKYAGKVKVGFPINAVGHILQISTLNLSNVIMSNSYVSEGKSQRRPDAKEVREFGILCRKISRIISSSNVESNISEILTSSAEKKFLPIMQNMISTNNKVNGVPAEPNMVNLGKFCEKILEWASKEKSAAKFNFFQMFYDKVLQEKSIAYAVTESRNEGKGKDKKSFVVFKFLTLVNWVDEYHTWIGLRKKDGDALGLDI